MKRRQQIANIVSYLGSLKGSDSATASVSPGGVASPLGSPPASDREPQNWLINGGSYAIQRYS